MKPEIILHDRDATFSKVFTETLTSRGLRTNPLPKRHVLQWVQIN